MWMTWRDAWSAALYGPEFAEALSGPPSSAFLAEGSPITVHTGIRIAL